MLVLTKSVQSLSGKVAKLVEGGGVQQAPEDAGDDAKSKLKAEADAEAAAKALEEIKALISQHAADDDYEKAFMTALGASKVELTLFCCGIAKVGDIFHSANGCAVSQTVLLCLLQQLGSSIASGKSTYKLETEWLQEVALTIDPSNPTIKSHLPQVKAQLIRHIKVGADSIKQDPTLIAEKRKLMGLLSIVSTIELA